MFQPARHSKLEKADILEMTVKHLESLQRQQSAMTVASDPSVMNKYRAGFSECATEVDKFLGRGDAPQLDAHLKRRLLSHLTSCLNNVTALDNLITDAPPTTPSLQAASTPAQTRMLRVQIPASATINGQHVMHLVPTCLPSGDIAFVIPKTMARSPLPAPAQLSPPLPPPPVEETAIPPPPFGSESAQSLAARTAVVAPLSVALDLSISSVVPLKQEDKLVMECVVDVDPMDQEDVWRPW
jgi:hairy and enhancer of split, invertebrate